MSTLPTTHADAEECVILVVDDDSSTRRLIENALARAGFALVTARDGAGGLAAARGRTPDLVLLDVSMPDMDGFEVCRQLKAAPCTSGIPIIFLTSSTDTESVVRGIDLGAVDYVTKPFKAAELLARVRTHLELKRSRDTILRVNERLRREIEERRRAESELRAERDHIARILHSLPAMVFAIRPDAIVNYVNPAAERIIGRGAASVTGKEWWQALYPSAGGEQVDDLLEALTRGEVRDYHMRMETASGAGRSIHWNTVNRYDEHGALSEIIALGNDLTDIDELMEKQEINIGLAKGILDLVNAPTPRYVDLPCGNQLFIESISLSCWAEGGDHFFARTHAPANGRGPGRTFISLKDQSGHEVGCVLRSIITDLVHNALLHAEPDRPLDELISRLNERLCASGLFQSDDFLTAFDLALDHATLALTFVSSGHPPLLFIHGGAVSILPGWEEEGANLPLTVSPETARTEGRLVLRPGDKLLLYTDGLTEMPQRRGRRFTQEEFKSLVEEVLAADPGAPVARLMRGVIALTAERSGEEVVPYVKNTAPDDVTVAGLEIEPPGCAGERVWTDEGGTELCVWIGETARCIAERWQAMGAGPLHDRLRLVLEEAVLNAWRHGNRKRPGSGVTVRWREANDFAVEVLDEGDGFEVQGVADPRSPANLTRASGRGIYLMRAAADHIRWADGGRRLIASFHRHPVPAPVRRAGQNRDQVPLWHWTE